jgi:hypothetical protein
MTSPSIIPIGSGCLFDLCRHAFRCTFWSAQFVRFVFAEFGSKRVLESVLDHNPIVDTEGRPDVASAASNPVAPDLNNTLKLHATMRSFSLVATAESIIGRTRDLFAAPPDSDPLSTFLTCQ